MVKYFLKAIFLLTFIVSVNLYAIEPIHKEGIYFKNSQGEIVKFWGVNVVAFYPDHQTAIDFAENLASKGVNLVRWHHMLLDASDWNWKSNIKALVTYNGDTRTPDNEAWDRFDFLNAELEKRGIYIMIAGEWTRTYLPGDVDIMTTDNQDRTDWMNAMSALNNMLNNDWGGWIDKLKMLVTFDERCARLNEEAITRLLEHQNPYQNDIKYKDNPQVLTFEIINEFSSEYTIYMGNHYDGYNSDIDYWDNELQSKFTDYCNNNGVTPFNLYDPTTDEQYRTRSDFLMQLDQDYFDRIKSLINSHNPTNNMNITFSNLWRGERSGKLHFDGAGYTEDHMYSDPFVASTKNDFFYNLSNYLVQNNKPYIVGELNMDEGEFQNMYPHRTMMYMALAVYGSLYNWSGVTWFAWNHGDAMVDTSSDNRGHGENELQEPSTDNNDLIGNLIRDRMIQDHFRTASTIFKNGFVSASSSPIEMWVDSTYMPWYPWPPTPMEQFKQGWQNIHSIRKMYGPKPPGQDNSEFMTQDPAHPYVSDNGEITKDTTRQQLTFSVNKAEGFSGNLDGNSPANLRIMSFSETSGFATVILVSNDNTKLENSSSLILSRTYIQGTSETNGPTITLSNLKQESGNYKWHIKYTRRKNSDDQSGFIVLDMDANNNLLLPNSDWRECELKYMEIGNTPPAAPTSLTASAVSNSQINLTWTDNSSNEDGFKIERSDDGGSSYNEIANVGANTTSYSNTGLASSTNYYYRVRAYNASGNSEYSNIANATTLGSENNNVQIPYTSIPPNVDAEIDEVWSHATSYPINNVIVGSVTSNQDLWGVWRALWDQDNLYYYVEIYDDSKQFDSGDLVYDDDAVELFIDADYSHGSTYDGINDFHYLFRWTEPVVHFGNNSVQNSDGIAFSINNMNSADDGFDGFVFEISIPWTTLGVTPSEGMLLGTEMELDDDDDGGSRDGKKAWLVTTDDCWQNPSLFGQAKLVSEGVMVETKIFLEGPYQSSTNEMTTNLSSSIPLTSPYPEDDRTVFKIPDNVVDWVLVQLRTSPGGGTITSKSAFLHKDGRIITDYENSGIIRLNAPESDYYIVIKHRNHLAVMSRNAIPLSKTGSTLYDFTTGSNKFYGNGGATQIENGVWGMWSGDADGSGVVDAADRNSTWNDRNKSGYENSDVDLSGVVDAGDRNKTWNNRNKSSQLP